jgi:hypothetical protein
LTFERPLFRLRERQVVDGGQYVEVGLRHANHQILLRGRELGISLLDIAVRLPELHQKIAVKQGLSEVERITVAVEREIVGTAQQEGGAEVLVIARIVCGHVDGRQQLRNGLRPLLQSSALGGGDAQKLGIAAQRQLVDIKKIVSAGCLRGSSEQKG